MQKGTTTKTTVTSAKTSTVAVSINGKPCPTGTSVAVAKALLARTKATCQVNIEHTVEVPIGAGFGTSAAGALTTALTIKEALDLPLTFNQIGKIAHVADIECQTGLGTVSSLAQSGGCVLVIEPGAPGVIDRIPIKPDYQIVTCLVKSTPKKDIFTSPQKRVQINQYGRKALNEILAKPSLENFLAACWQFAQDAGFATETVRKLVKAANQAGAVGAAQNMLGEAVHAVVNEENTADVAEAFKQVVPKENVLISKIDFQGARLLSGDI